MRFDASQVTFVLNLDLDRSMMKVDQNTPKNLFKYDIYQPLADCMCGGYH